MSFGSRRCRAIVTGWRSGAAPAAGSIAPLTRSGWLCAPVCGSSALPRRPTVCERPVSKDPRFKTTEVSEPEGPERDEPARAQLRVVYPAELAAALPLERARILLGRQPDDEHAAPLLHGTVSRKHFAIEWDGRLKRHTGVDLGSRNGSNVDGPPAAAPTPLGSASAVPLANLPFVHQHSPRPRAPSPH